MNIFNKVTIKTLKKNRTRTIVTIIGIILSAAMLTGVTTFISSLQNYLIETAESVDGSWHAKAFEITGGQLAEIKADDRVKAIDGFQNIGYAKVDGIKNEDKPYIFVAGFTKGVSDMVPVHLDKGRMAQNSSEIVLPAHLSDNGGLNFKVGDTITLPIGERIAAGRSLGQMVPYNDMLPETGVPESIEIKQTRTYTVVGICARPSFEDMRAPGYSAITVADTDITGYTQSVFVQLKHPSDANDFCEDMLKDNKPETNNELLMFLGSSTNNTVNQVMYTLAVILFALIMIGSVSLIYNAFSISVSERIRDFGLLSSIGATKRQLRKSIMFEALAVSVIGIPIGIISGIGGIAATLFFIGDSFANIMTTASDAGKISVSVSLPATLIAAVFALVTVLISAFAPSVRASRVSAIDAIRQTNDINVKPRKVKTSKVVYKLFGLEGMLSNKNFKRNRKRYRTTVVSLFISIVLFISTSAFCSYLTAGTGDAFSSADYDISYTQSADSTISGEELYTLLSKTEGVKKSGRAKGVSAMIKIPEDQVSEGYKKFLLDQDMDIHDYTGATIAILPDSEYKTYIESLKLDPAKYMNPSAPLGVMTDQINGYNPKTQRVEKCRVFAVDAPMLDLNFMTSEKQQEYYGNSDYENTDIAGFLDKYSIKAGKIVDALPIGVSNSLDSGVNLVLCESVANSVFGDMSDYSVSDSFYFLAPDHINVYEKMKDTLSNNSLPYGPLNDAAGREEVTRSLLLIVNVFSYGFIALISLIAAANVFNTISTGIALRRREFAMLRSVGLAKKSFGKIMNYECLMYAFKSLVIGLPVSIGVSYLMFAGMVRGIDIGFYIPVTSMIIAAATVFLSVYLSMAYAMGKIKKDNPIDALKNENM